MLSANKRYLFTSLMGCKGEAKINNGAGFTTLTIADMPNFLVAHFEGFRAEWSKFILEDTPRVHKLLERADMKGDIDTMRLLFEGKRSADDVVDYDLVAFLRYYVSNAQICFNNICNASGCLNVASKTCSRCKVARYCSRECQITDWRASHKHSCDDLKGWKPDTSLCVNVVE